jgi:hypothetical protein
MVLTGAARFDDPLGAVVADNIVNRGRRLPELRFVERGQEPPPLSARQLPCYSVRYGSRLITSGTIQDDCFEPKLISAPENSYSNGVMKGSEPELLPVSRTPGLGVLVRSESDDGTAQGIYA